MSLRTLDDPVVLCCWQQDRGNKSDSEGSDSEVTYHSGESDGEGRAGSFSSRDSVDEEEEKRREAESVEPLTLANIRACTITRSALIKYQDEPFFKDMILKSFVRVLSKPAQRFYSIAQVLRAQAAHARG